MGQLEIYGAVTWFGIGDHDLGTQRLEAALMKQVVTPIVGGKALKGPLDRLMSDLGIESSAYGVAQLYKGVAQGFVIDNIDKQLVPKIKDLDMKVVPTQTIMYSAAAKAKLAQDTMRLAENL